MGLIGNIIISIPLTNLDEINDTSKIPISCISCLEISSTFAVIRNVLANLENNEDLLECKDGRCIVIGVYGIVDEKGYHTNSQTIISCLDYAGTKNVLQGIVSLLK